MNTYVQQNSKDYFVNKFPKHNDNYNSKRQSYKHELNCPNSDLVEFWKEPSTEDIHYKSPYLDDSSSDRVTKYVTFEPGKFTLFIHNT